MNDAASLLTFFNTFTRVADAAERIADNLERIARTQEKPATATIATSTDTPTVNVRLPEATGNPNSDDTGARFLHWLSEGLRTGQHPVNTTEAFLHTTKEGVLLVSPRAFKLFSPDNWNCVQKRFTKLKLHKPAPNGSSFWMYHVRGEKKQGMVRGLLISDPLETLGCYYLPAPNKALSLQNSQPNITTKPTATKVDDTLWIRLAETNGQTVDSNPAYADKQGFFIKYGWRIVGRFSHQLSIGKIRMNEPDSCAFLLPDGKLLLKYPDIFGSKKDKYTIAAFKQCGLHIRNTKTPKMLWSCTIVLNDASITLDCVVVEDAVKKLLLQLPPNINTSNITAEIIGLNHQAMPDTGQDTTPRMEGCTTPTVILAEPDASNTMPPPPPDWTDGFTHWLRQQMLDSKCPPDVASVGQGKLLVGSQAFVAYCRDKGGKVQQWAMVLRKFREGVGVTKMAKYCLSPNTTTNRQKSCIWGVLIESPGAVLSLPQSAIPQQGAYIAESAHTRQVKKKSDSTKPAETKKTPPRKKPTKSNKGKSRAIQ